MQKILLVHGPNLNMLGRREKKHYGSFALADVVENVEKIASSKGYDVLAYQSNHEGDLIDFIHEHLDESSGMLINAGALTHYSYALLDCLTLCPYPIIEVHISDIEQRESFRQVSVIRAACADVVMGQGFKSYELGLEKLWKQIEEN